MNRRDCHPAGTEEFQHFPTVDPVCVRWRINASQSQDEAPAVLTQGQVVWRIGGNNPSESSHGKETTSGDRLHCGSCKDY
jgi:hypothetical protein